MSEDRSLLARVQSAFLGLHAKDTVTDWDGQTTTRPRTYLDSTATALMPELVWQGLESYLLGASANSHTPVHRAGRATTLAIEEARDAMGELVGYDPERDVVLLEGNGATGAINFLARALFPPELRAPLKRARTAEEAAPLVAGMKQTFPEATERLERLMERPLVVISLLEHHSNILPWIEAVGRHHLRVVGMTEDGRLDMEHLQRILDTEGQRVRLVAITGASNVTGVLTPIHDIARRAHRVGAQLMVDAAQLAPHRPIRMHTDDPEQDLDFLVISGHKLYAPGSRGALIGPLAQEDCACVGDVGGGMVEFVSMDDFTLKQEITAREEAGTPNIPGTVALGLAAKLLKRLDMQRVAEEEEALTAYALERLTAIEGLTVYGPRDPAARVGVIACNVHGLRHNVVASALDDAYAIAVRNDCFCAHPYVKALLECSDASEQHFRKQLEHGDRSTFPGMVRISLGMYSSRKDVDAVCDALSEIVRLKDRLADLYEIDQEGHCHRRDVPTPAEVYRLDDVVDASLARL